jgi:Major Facilitator Superfamily
VDSPLYLKKTKWAYILTRVFDAPFWAIFNMLAFILYKDLHATPFQLAMLVTLKPLVSVFSSYWSSWTSDHRDHLIYSILGARFLAFLPFFLYPWMYNPWFFVASFGFYMLFVLGSVPAWMELLKINLPDKIREKVFSHAQVLAYIIGGLLPYVLGNILDHHSQAWRWIFPLTALLGLSASFFQLRIQIKPHKINEFSNILPISFRDFSKPWKNAWSILKERPDFFNFQIGFMFLGGGLMIMQPVLTMFFVDELQLSYTEMALALAFFKGFGFLMGSPVWSVWIKQVNIFYFCSVIALLASLFPFGLICAKSSLIFLYVSYFLYGFLQAGSELVWNLSGPIFSKENNSIGYTNINMLAVGLRGCFVPFLGSLLVSIFSSGIVMVIGGMICLLGIFQFSFYSRRVALNDSTIEIDKI